MYFYFRGKYVVALKSGTPISLEFVANLIKTEYPLAYIEQKSLSEWQSWTKARHPHLDPAIVDAPDANAKQTSVEKKNLYGNKRNEWFKFIQGSIVVRDTKNTENVNLEKKAHELLKSSIQAPCLDWYFEQFHEPPDLFQHNARVSTLTILLLLRMGQTEIKNIEELIQSIVLHELDGDPKSSMNGVVSEKSISLLENKGRPIPKGVIELIHLQDELVSGKGFPKNLKADQIPLGIKAFSLCNHFDHYRLQASGANRRIKFEQTKKHIEARKQDYDADIYRFFWPLIENEFEVLG